MSGREKIPNWERFPYRKDEHGNNLCRWCGKPVPPPKQTFCGPRCVRDFKMVTDWQRVRRVIYERDGGICMKCGKEVPNKKGGYHVDHIVPISEGGAEWDLNNLELSCPECNLKKGAKIE
ncbi:HNH endonuclease [Desulfoscipio geothermicus]|uniref:HNH endonuclease n=1 Tax=Desulfoscipio geothermicus DSM 3669 TaxID=1121426 RepID=A0A1I6EC40_9FIRM|nr:HNH endonuclease signature motif containing protein [Desulfoscipio geothermicus]SFR15316.1 HNH endonuclease [Desulfoscipio geothermicus DSM 3669]